MEYHAPEGYLKPNVDASAKERERYITAKYRDRLFVQSASKIAPKPPVYAPLANRTAAE